MRDHSKTLTQLKADLEAVVYLQNYWRHNEVMMAALHKRNEEIAQQIVEIVLPPRAG